ncbi:MAG: hypothetical protein DMF49_03075 [Acidobacteria bacterium]|nr:MAG: hypothetical protein DMF49_03075 [Acidobacteriota bacterium]
MKSRKSSGIEVLALVAVVTIVVSVAGASSFTFDTLNSVSEKAKESLLAVRVAGDLIEMYGDEHLVFPGPTDGLVPLASLRQTLDIPARRYFPQHDAWGHGLLYWSNGFDYMILSEGSDGRPDYAYDQHGIPYDGIMPGVNASDTQDIILVHDALLRGPFGSRNSPRKTMADLRSIGTACEEYALDNNFYPNFAVSTGADAAADAPYQTWTTPQFLALLNMPPSTQTDLRKDILFGQGQFIQWPAGIVP